MFQRPSCKSEIRKLAKTQHLEAKTQEHPNEMQTVQIQVRYVASFRNKGYTKATAVGKSTPNFGLFTPSPAQLC